LFKMRAMSVPLFYSQPKLWRRGSVFTIGLIGGISKFALTHLSETKIYTEGDSMESIIRTCHDNNQPLITVANHMSCLDDPMLWGALLSMKALWTQWDSIRWIPGAEENCFYKDKNLQNLFVSWGKVMSCRRGDGVYQPCMNFAVERLNLGESIHLYVEGQVNVSRTIPRIKWGVGRLVADCKRPPVILPFVHRGMDKLLPLKDDGKSTWIPQLGKKISILVGNPIYTDKILADCKRFKFTEVAIRKHIADITQRELQRLAKKLDDKLATSVDS